MYSLFVTYFIYLLYFMYFVSIRTMERLYQLKIEEWEKIYFKTKNVRILFYKIEQFKI